MLGNEETISPLHIDVCVCVKGSGFEAGCRLADRKSQLVSPCCHGNSCLGISPLVSRRPINETFYHPSNRGRLNCTRGGKSRAPHLPSVVGHSQPACLSHVDPQQHILTDVYRNDTNALYVLTLYTVQVDLQA